MAAAVAIARDSLARGHGRRGVGRHDPGLRQPGAHLAGDRGELGVATAAGIGDEPGIGGDDVAGGSVGSAAAGVFTRPKASLPLQVQPGMVFSR